MKNLLFLFLKVALMFFLSFKVFAIQDLDYPEEKNPAANKNPIDDHISNHSAINDSSAGQAGVSMKDSYAPLENRPSTDTCPGCKANILRNDNTGATDTGNGNATEVKPGGIKK